MNTFTLKIREDGLVNIEGLAIQDATDLLKGLQFSSIEKVVVEPPRIKRFSKTPRKTSRYMHKHRRVCEGPDCGRGFLGRSNQRFHNGACKSRFYRQKCRSRASRSKSKKMTKSEAGRLGGLARHNRKVSPRKLAALVLARKALALKRLRDKRLEKVKPTVLIPGDPLTA